MNTLIIYHRLAGGMALGTGEEHGKRTDRRNASAKGGWRGWGKRERAINDLDDESILFFCGRGIPLFSWSFVP